MSDSPNEQEEIVQLWKSWEITLFWGIQTHTDQTARLQSAGCLCKTWAALLRHAPFATVTRIICLRGSTRPTACSRALDQTQALDKLRLWKVNLYSVWQIVPSLSSLPNEARKIRKRGATFEIKTKSGRSARGLRELQWCCVLFSTVDGMLNGSDGFRPS